MVDPVNMLALENIYIKFEAQPELQHSTNRLRIGVKRAASHASRLINTAMRELSLFWTSLRLVPIFGEELVEELELLFTKAIPFLRGLVPYAPDRIRRGFAKIKSVSDAVKGELRRVANPAGDQILRNMMSETVRFDHRGDSHLDAFKSTLTRAVQASGEEPSKQANLIEDLYRVSKEAWSEAMQLFRDFFDDGSLQLENARKARNDSENLQQTQSHHDSVDAFAWNANIIGKEELKQRVRNSEIFTPEWLRRGFGMRTLSGCMYIQDGTVLYYPVMRQIRRSGIRWFRTSSPEDEGYEIVNRQAPVVPDAHRRIHLDEEQFLALRAMITKQSDLGKRSQISVVYSDDAVYGLNWHEVDSEPTEGEKLTNEELMGALRSSMQREPASIKLEPSVWDTLHVTSLSMKQYVAIQEGRGTRYFQPTRIGGFSTLPNSLSGACYMEIDITRDGVSEREKVYYRTVDEDERSELWDMSIGFEWERVDAARLFTDGGDWEKVDSVYNRDRKLRNRLFSNYLQEQHGRANVHLSLDQISNFNFGRSLTIDQYIHFEVKDTENNSKHCYYKPSASYICKLRNEKRFRRMINDATENPEQRRFSFPTPFQDVEGSLVVDSVVELAHPEENRTPLYYRVVPVANVRKTTIPIEKIDALVAKDANELRLLRDIVDEWNLYLNHIEYTKHLALSETRGHLPLISPETKQVVITEDGTVQVALHGLSWTQLKPSKGVHARLSDNQVFGDMARAVLKHNKTSFLHNEIHKNVLRWTEYTRVEQQPLLWEKMLTIPPAAVKVTQFPRLGALLHRKQSAGGKIELTEEEWEGHKTTSRLWTVELSLLVGESGKRLNGSASDGAKNAVSSPEVSKADKKAIDEIYLDASNLRVNLEQHQLVDMELAPEESSLEAVQMRITKTDCFPVGPKQYLEHKTSDVETVYFVCEDNNMKEWSVHGQAYINQSHHHVGEVETTPFFTAEKRARLIDALLKRLSAKTIACAQDFVVNQFDHIKMDGFYLYPVALNPSSFHYLAVKNVVEAQASRVCHLKWELTDLPVKEPQGNVDGMKAYIRTLKLGRNWTVIDTPEAGTVVHEDSEKLLAGMMDDDPDSGSWVKSDKIRFKTVHAGTLRLKTPLKRRVLSGDWKENDVVKSGNRYFKTTLSPVVFDLVTWIGFNIDNLDTSHVVGVDDKRFKPVVTNKQLEAVVNEYSFYQPMFNPNTRSGWRFSSIDGEALRPIVLRTENAIAAFTEKMNDNDATYQDFCRILGQSISYDTTVELTYSDNSSSCFRLKGSDCLKDAYVKENSDSANGEAKVFQVRPTKIQFSALWGRMCVEWSRDNDSMPKPGVYNISHVEYGTSGRVGIQRNDEGKTYFFINTSETAISVADALKRQHLSSHEYLGQIDEFLKKTASMKTPIELRDALSLLKKENSKLFSEIQTGSLVQKLRYYREQETVDVLESAINGDKSVSDMAWNNSNSACSYLKGKLNARQAAVEESGASLNNMLAEVGVQVAFDGSNVPNSLFSSVENYSNEKYKDLVTHTRNLRQLQEIEKKVDEFKRRAVQRTLSSSEVALSAYGNVGTETMVSPETLLASGREILSARRG